MARLRRLFVPGLTMHVIQRGAHRASIFRRRDDYGYFLAFLREAAKRFGLAVHGFGLMTNHVHLMATPRDATSLACTMQQVGRWYVPYFNACHGFTGTLWQGRYRAIPVAPERWLTCLRYVEHNPFRAGMVDAPELSPWTSYRAHAFGEPAEWLTPHDVYLRLGATAGERQACYRALCSVDIDAVELEQLRYAVHHGWAYGSQEFARRIEELTARPARPRRPGRRARQS